MPSSSSSSLCLLPSSLLALLLLLLSIVKYIAETNLAVIELQGCRLDVDTHLLGSFGAKLKCLFQFVGELGPSPSDGGRDGGGALQLTARVASNVDGLDLDVFYKTLELRRSFLDDRGKAGGGAARKGGGGASS